MRIVFFSVVLNHHQAPVADALWRLCDRQYTFVELTPLADAKGAVSDYSQRPYLLRAWESDKAYAKAMELAKTAAVCVFSGVASLPFETARMRLGRLSFDMGERWLKRGWKSLLSPNLLKWRLAYTLGGWGRKPLYKLCCSAFCAADHYRLHTFRNKCYKWGYFTSVAKNCVEAFPDVPIPLMWCSRYLVLKHPELPVLMAHRLRRQGYRFRLDMYGSGPYEGATQQLAKKLGVDDVVRFVGVKPNDELLSDMRRHEIFLFTSDRNEGWGVVANESMANGCVLVASDGIGSSRYLVEDGQTGLLFRSPLVSSGIAHPDSAALDSLCEKVAYLLRHSAERRAMRQRSLSLMQNVWNPQVAAERLLVLIDLLQADKDTIYENGPCSKA